MSQRKRIRLLFPQLQLRLLTYILLSTGVSVVLTACIAAQALASLAKDLPNDGDMVMDQMPSLLLNHFGIALVVALPVFALLAFLISMPYVGVAYRLHSFLKATGSGEQTMPCRLRTNDPMQDVCELINKATLGQREKNAADGDETVANDAA